MTDEAQIHEYGKMIFEDAAGKTIQLPPSISPRFQPPRSFTIKRAEFERAIPWAGYAGRQPDVVLTSNEGRKLIVEIKNSNGKTPRYLDDMAQAGFHLIVELDVAAWKRARKDLRPDFSSPTMLQNVIDQVTWLSPGKPSAMSWRPYGMVIYMSCENKPECHGSICMTLLNGKPFHRAPIKGKDERPQYGKMFYRSPLVSFEEAAKHLGMSNDETRTHIRKVMSNAHSECEGLSVITRDQNGMITEAADRNPGTTQRENGWVLCRDQIELPSYRIRQPEPNSYQAIIYPCPLNGDVLAQNFDESRTSAPQFPTRNRWTEAVKDLFKKLASQAEPIYRTPDDPWLPTNLR